MLFATALHKALDEIDFPKKGRQNKLAQALSLESKRKITQEAVRKWLEGEGYPKDDNLINLAKVTHKPLQYFIDAKMGASENTNNTVLSSKDVDYFPDCFSLGKETRFTLSPEFIANTYYVYELDDGKQTIKIMRRIKKEGFETYLVADTPNGKAYNLADYKFVFIGSVIDIQVIY